MVFVCVCYGSLFIVSCFVCLLRLFVCCYCTLLLLVVECLINSVVFELLRRCFVVAIRCDLIKL